MDLQSGERASRVVAELALQSTELRAFREGLLELLDHAVGFDKASAHGLRAGVPETCSRGWDRPAAFAAMPQYMTEFRPEEIAIASQGRFIVDVEVMTQKRREELSLYRLLLRPEKVSVFTTLMWRSDEGVAGLSLARTGAGARFRPAEGARLEALLPAIRAGGSLVALRERADAERPFRAFADASALSPRERDVTALVVRGLQNREIASVLSMSANTVRNHLAAIFRKADVSTRAELVFAATMSAQSKAPAPRWAELVR